MADVVETSDSESVGKKKKLALKLLDSKLPNLLTFSPKALSKPNLSDKKLPSPNNSMCILDERSRHTQ